MLLVSKLAKAEEYNLKLEAKLNHLNEHFSKICSVLQAQIDADPQTKMEKL